MKMLKLVCPNKRALIDRLERRTLCVRINFSEDVAAAVDAAKARNSLFCVICDSNVPLDEIEIPDGWPGEPIALMVPSVGRFGKISKKLVALRKLDLRVYLPYGKENLVGARMLASVGIAAGMVFDPGETPDWDAIADLMTYGLLGAAPHAPIEPFQTMATAYRRDGRSEDWGHAWFDDPSCYLHIDEAGRIALSRTDLLAGEFVADDLSELDSPVVSAAIEDRTEAWRNLFFENHFCARCKGWRLCHGRFCDGKPTSNGCDDFFNEMTSVIEQYRRKMKLKRPVERWQP